MNALSRSPELRWWPFSRNQVSVPTPLQQNSVLDQKPEGVVDSASNDYTGAAVVSDGRQQSKLPSQSEKHANSVRTHLLMLLIPSE